MAKYLISFPSAAMVVPDGEWDVVGRDAHAVRMFQLDPQSDASVRLHPGEPS